jgi:hypothetical protein
MVTFNLFKEIYSLSQQLLEYLRCLEHLKSQLYLSHHTLMNLSLVSYQGLNQKIAFA